MPGIRAKASALFAGAAHATLNLGLEVADLMTLSPSMLPDLAVFEVTIHQFLAAMPPVETLDTAVPEIKQILVVVRSLALASLIKLSEPFTSVGAPHAHQPALQAAREMVDVIRHIADSDYEFLDPVLGATWLLAATTLFREVSIIESAWPLSTGSSDIRQELLTVFFAMTSLSQRFPILGIVFSLFHG
jgi:hypothetical protein